MGSLLEKVCHTALVAGVRRLTHQSNLLAYDMTTPRSNFMDAKALSRDDKWLQSETRMLLVLSKQGCYGHAFYQGPVPLLYVNLFAVTLNIVGMGIGTSAFIYLNFYPTG